MGLVLGTNCGFVSVAPTVDPLDNAIRSVDSWAFVTKHTSAGNAAKITEVGWWCDNATQETNFEVGLYDDTGTGGNAGTLLEVNRTNAKGTTAGWKVVSGLNWTISPSTIYWIAVQVDNTSTATYSNDSVFGGAGRDIDYNPGTMENPYGGGAIGDVDGMYAIYALYTTGEVPSEPAIKVINPRGKYWGAP